jgi:hypothetical protein
MDESEGLIERYMRNKMWEDFGKLLMYFGQL